MNTKTPRSDALINAIFAETAHVGPHNCPENWVKLCRELELETLALHRYQNGLEAEIKELRITDTAIKRVDELEAENARLLDYVARIARYYGAGCSHDLAILARHILSSNGSNDPRESGK